ncbi:MAG: hypothetical protein R3C59_14220 [Planctomycetaceae bacterium]
MKYFSIQRIGNHRREDREIRIAEGQRATLGAAVDADLMLRRSVGVPAYCLQVWVERGKCLAENVSRNPRLITLNRQPLYSVAQLEQGDLLQIGDDQFTVVYQDETPIPLSAPVVAPVVAPVEAVPPPYVPSTALNSVRLDSAVVRHEPHDSAWEVTEVLRQLAEAFQAFPLINVRHAGALLPQRLDCGDDLFAHAPDEVRETYSLHALDNATVDQMLGVHQQFKDQDAVVWVVPEDDPATCLKEAKIYLAWFARASVLEMTLQQSPKVFTEALLKPFRAIVLEPTGGSNWVMYTKSDFDPAEFQFAESLAAGL